MIRLMRGQCANYSTDDGSYVNITGATSKTCCASAIRGCVKFEDMDRVINELIEFKRMMADARRDGRTA